MFDNIFDTLDASSACISCGCTDECACDGGCWWLLVDRSLGKGVCSNCPRARPRFRELVATSTAPAPRALPASRQPARIRAARRRAGQAVRSR